MELGALICTPKSPSCFLCPVQSECRAFAQGIEEELPVKTSKKKQKKHPYLLLVITNEEGEVLIEKRPDEGLLASLWQYPMVPMEDLDMEAAVHWFYGEYGLSIRFEETVTQIKHVFSHLIWEMDVVKATVTGGELDRARARFVDEEALEAYPFPVSHQKAHPYINR